ncbi:DinB family protein [Aquimarina longa]|uniref:DinB family protein n=1 Tax=Aquimarina longa TaxID=1080221 RepID=UPI000782299D|nr:DinB family protein [Aquimarina longa]
MKTNIEESIIKLEEVFDGEPWFGTSIIKSLKQIPVKFWNKKLEKGSHTIAALVYHSIDWRRFVIEKIKNNRAFTIELNSEQDWRKNIVILYTEKEKEKVINELVETQNVICALLAEKPDSWLQEQVSGASYINEYMIQGVLQHDVYHLGQINMIHSRLK